MKTRCHNCGATASLDLLVSTNAAGQAFAEAFNAPAPLAPLMLKYLGMFRPLERELGFGRATTLLKEINPFINKGKLTYNRISTDAPLAAWAWGINQVMTARDKGTLKLPLGNHNYLFSIVQGYDHRKHSTEGDIAAQSYAGASGDTGATVMLNGLRKAVFSGKSQKETYDIVKAAYKPGDSMDETYERIKDQY